MEVGWWALIISGASLSLSAATFWRNRTPTPRWVPSITIDRHDEHRVRVTGAVENRGRGTARDVQFEHFNGGMLSLFTRRKAEHVEFGGKLSITLLYPADTTGRGWFRLAWCQEPNLHRQRTKKVRFDLGGGTGELPEPAHNIDVL